MQQKIFQVDAFTREPYKGNPAAVCVLPEEKSEEWMQAVAREMNVAETAFLLADGADNFRLRWFTPTIEIKLCGHATLACAHVLWEEGLVKEDALISFQTLSGTLKASRAGEWIELDFPAEPPAQQNSYPLELRDALNIEPLYVGRNRFDFLVEVESEKALRRLAPDMRLLRSLDVRGVIVTSSSDDAKYDFVARFFAPGAGIDEDPVTGSAYCCLGPYWRERAGRDEMMAYQASPRGGEVRVRLAGGGRVLLGGQAVTVLRGELLYA